MIDRRASTGACAALALCAALLLSPAFAAPAPADGTPVRDAASGFSLVLPAEWRAQPGLLGAALSARPPESDRDGWAQDLLLVTSEPYDARRTCLDGFVLRKLKDMGHLAEGFEVLDETPLTLGTAQATRVELRYKEGSRVLAGYLVVMQTPHRMVALTLQSEPNRFELQRARFLRVIDSLRPLR